MKKSNSTLGLLQGRLYENSDPCITMKFCKIKIKARFSKLLIMLYSLLTVNGFDS